MINLLHKKNIYSSKGLFTIYVLQSFCPCVSKWVESNSMVSSSTRNIHTSRTLINPSPPRTRSINAPVTTSRLPPLPATYTPINTNIIPPIPARKTINPLVRQNHRTPPMHDGPNAFYFYILF